MDVIEKVSGPTTWISPVLCASHLVHLRLLMMFVDIRDVNVMDVLWASVDPLDVLKTFMGESVLLGLGPFVIKGYFQKSYAPIKYFIIHLDNL